MYNLNSLEDFRNLRSLDKKNLFKVPNLFQSPDEDYETERGHSEIVDHLLGFQVDEIEARLLTKAKETSPDGNIKNWGQHIHQGNQTWVGLSLQTLQTPYNELRKMCHSLNLKQGDHLVDLGAGYGRLGLILKYYYPGIRFTGFEYVPERVEEGNRIFQFYECSQSTLIEQDLGSPKFQLPIADYYFLYDYGNLFQMRMTINQLENLALNKKFKVIARGHGIRSIIDLEHPWLSQVFPVQRERLYSVYSMSSDLIS
ncbi:MAG: hypothetical protein AB7I27_10935 [Bacteriovoracaceae bacterium]